MATTYKTIYKCRICGTTSYQRVMMRGAGGVLQPSGIYRCTGCRNEFESLRAWWEGPRTPMPAPEPMEDSSFADSH